MKKAVKILSIIACVIGIIWSLVGIFGGAVCSGTQAAFENAEKAEKLKEKYVNSSLFHVGSFASILIGLIFAIVGTIKKSRKITIIICGIFLMIFGVFSTICRSYFAGPIYVICGILLTIHGIIIKQEKKSL